MIRSGTCAVAGRGQRPPAQVRLMRQHWSVMALVCSLVACEPLEDSVFETKVARLILDPVRVREGSGVVQIPVRLEAPLLSAFEVTFDVRGIEAQDDCHEPDFEGGRGTLVFSADSDRARLNIWIGDDNLAETDERLEVWFSPVLGGTLLGPTSLTITIEDDDRDALLEATSYGVSPNTGHDQTEPLQAALDAAAERGRAVLTIPPGDYEVRSLSMTPGTTLSARGAKLLRPVASPPDIRTLSVRHAGSEHSTPTLIEGLSVDGRRDLQGAYQGYEQENAHLIMLEGDADQPGRLTTTLQHVSITSATGDGVAVGPNSDVSLCHIQAHDIWRDAVSLHGGRSSLRVRGLDATASEGTSGIWLDGYILGYEDTRTVDVEIEDARLNTGDVEMEVVDGSTVVLRRLSMTEPPFRVLAPNSTVEVIDSVIQLGIPSSRHNNFTMPHDVRLLRTTIVTSERIDEEPRSEEMERSFATLNLRWVTEEMAEPPSGEHLFKVDSCHFTLALDIEPTDTLYAITNPTPGGAIQVHNSLLGEGFAGWFAPGCLDCQLVE